MQVHILIVHWAPSSEFVSSSIPSWQILTAHAQPFRGARDLAFCLKVPHDSLLVWASSGGSGETTRMHRPSWTFTARISDKYQIRLTRSNYKIGWCKALQKTIYLVSLVLCTWCFRYYQKTRSPSHNVSVVKNRLKNVTSRCQILSWSKLTNKKFSHMVWC